jgi:uncharacterized protein
MQKTDHARELAAILDRLEEGSDRARIERDALELLERLAPGELVAAEEELRQRGMPLERMQRLCPSHMAVQGDQRGAFRASLADDHVIATLMDEHQRILAELGRLAGLVRARPEPATLEQVAAVAETLIGAEPHHQREEEVLFPELRERGIEGPPTVMRAEHAALRELKHALHDGALAALDGRADAWPACAAAGERLVGMLRDHIFKEDNVLYPLAVRAIEPQAWAGMKRRCDAIGYCRA